MSKSVAYETIIKMHAFSIARMRSHSFFISHILSTIILDRILQAASKKLKS